MVHSATSCVQLQQNNQKTESRNKSITYLRKTANEKASEKFMSHRRKLTKESEKSRCVLVLWKLMDSVWTKIFYDSFFACRCVTYIPVYFLVLISATKVSFYENKNKIPHLFFPTCVVHQIHVEFNFNLLTIYDLQLLSLGTFRWLSFTLAKGI